MKHNNSLSVMPLLLMLLIPGLSPFAADPKAPDNSAIKKAQGLIRQLSQEKTALEAEKTALLNEKADLQAKLSQLEQIAKKLQPLQNEVEQYKGQLETTRSDLQSQLEQERQQRQAVMQKHNEVVVKANAIFADNQLLVEAVKEREQWISQCTESNRKLQEANQAILQKYQDKNIFQQLGELEPLTGIGRVETESAVEDYRYQLKQLKITPFESNLNKTGSTSAPAATTQETPQ